MVDIWTSFDVIFILNDLLEFFGDSIILFFFVIFIMLHFEIVLILVEIKKSFNLLATIPINPVVRKLIIFYHTYDLSTLRLTCKNATLKLTQRTDFKIMHLTRFETRRFCQVEPFVSH